MQEETHNLGAKVSLTTFVEPAFFDDRDLIHGGSINTLSPSLGWLRAAGHAGGASDTVRSTRDKRGAVRVGAPSWALRPFGSVAGRAFGIAREPGSQGARESSSLGAQS